MHSRQSPETPCDVILSEDEWKALTVFFTKKPPPSKPPSLYQAVVWIASLGGFMGRKGDGHPGTTTTWRGLQRLEGIALGFALGFSMAQQRDGPYPPLR
jgi:hypothetical protein